MRMTFNFCSLFLLFSVFLNAFPKSHEADHKKIYVKASPTFAYVVNQNSNSISPINILTNTAQTPISGGFQEPFGIAITPNGKTAYVTNSTTNQVIPINLTSNTAGTPISGFNGPTTIAITPDEKTAYVTNLGSNVVIIDITSNTITTSIPVNNIAPAIAITPDGKTLYVGTFDDTVVPINTTTNSPGTPIALSSIPPSSSLPWNAAISPDGTKLYVVNLNKSVTIINTQTNTRITTLDFGSSGATCVAITPDGTTAYVTLTTDSSIVPINTATNAVGSPISMGITDSSPYGIAISPDGKTAYVVLAGINSVMPVDLATRTTLTPIPVGTNPLNIAIAATTSLPPEAPKKFKGKLIHHKPGHKARATLKTRWQASSSSNIARYEIFAYNKRIASIAGRAPLRYKKHLHSNYLWHTHIPKKYLRHINKKYRIRAVNDDGIASTFTKLHTHT